MLELELVRDCKSKISTSGVLLHKDDIWCYSLEDIDRGLTAKMSLEKIKLIKVDTKTAIPSGRYEVIMSYSNRFKKFMPLLLNVPGFAGVRIHAGNTVADTEGCILLGYKRFKDSIGDSRKAVDMFYAELEKYLKLGKVYLTVK